MWGLGCGRRWSQTSSVVVVSRHRSAASVSLTRRLAACLRVFRSVMQPLSSSSLPHFPSPRRPRRARLSAYCSDRACRLRVFRSYFVDVCGLRVRCALCVASSVFRFRWPVAMPCVPPHRTQRTRTHSGRAPPSVASAPVLFVATWCPRATSSGRAAIARVHRGWPTTIATRRLALRMTDRIAVWLPRRAVEQPAPRSAAAPCSQAKPRLHFELQQEQRERRTLLLRGRGVVGSASPAAQRLRRLPNLQSDAPAPASHHPAALRTRSPTPRTRHTLH